MIGGRPVAACLVLLLAALSVAPAAAQPVVSLSSPAMTPTPTKPNDSATPTELPTCGPTGTPYCASQCSSPCPTIRENCFAHACGHCIPNPVCGPGESCERNNTGPPYDCCRCVTPTPTPTPPPIPCVGDCDADARVVIAELVRMVDCGLGTIDSTCDQCAEQAPISIATLVLAVTHALQGCPTPVPIEQLVLAEAWEEFECYFARPPRAPYCDRGPGHWTSASLGRFPSAEAAHAEFDVRRGDAPLQALHGYPAASWEFDERPGETLPFHHRFHVWVAGEFLAGVHSFDDTIYRLAYDPQVVSEAIYDRAVLHGLIQPADW